MLRRPVAPVLLAILCVTPASAGEPTERLQRLFADANRILTAPAGEAAVDERLRDIRALLHDAIDAGEAVAFALGPAWQARTPAERDELVRLYADLVERAYLAWLGSRARVHADGVRMAFESETIDGDRAVVRTKLDTRAAETMTVDYRMRRRDGRWLVHDVVVDGLSLADSYRAQFQRVLQDGSYPQLLARLHDKASTDTLLAIARAERARPAATAPGSPPVVGAGATAPSAAPAVRIASVAPISDAAPMPQRPAPAPLTAAATRPELESTPTRGAVPPGERAGGRVGGSTPRAHAIVPPAPPSFWIQIGAFRSTELASRLVERLRQYRVAVATAARPSGAVARVLVGPFADRAAAAPTLRELIAGGHRPFIAAE